MYLFITPDDATACDRQGPDNPVTAALNKASESDTANLIVDSLAGIDIEDIARIVTHHVGSNRWMIRPTIMTTSDTPEEAESVMTYTRISADADGESHFSDEQVALDEADTAPPAPPVNMSSPTSAENVSFVTLPAGWPEDVDDPHVAQTRNYWIVLSGEIELTASDGETRQFPPGSVLLAEDTTGRGHTTTVVSDGQVELAVVGTAD